MIYRRILLTLIALALVIVYLVEPTRLIREVTGQGIPSPARGKVVVIDPGHGGEDPGVWDEKTNIREKDINWAIARELQKLLVQKGVKVVLTRDGDPRQPCPFSLLRPKKNQPADLEQRIDLACRAKGDILVSIHVNAAAKPNYGGPEVYYYPGSPDGSLLAQKIQQELLRIREMVKRLPRTGNYYLLHHSPLPAVIVETGYLTYLPEKEKLARPSYRKRLAQAMAAGIENYFREISHLPRAGTGKERRLTAESGGERRPTTAKPKGQPPTITLFFPPVVNTSALLESYRLEPVRTAFPSSLSLAREVLARLLQGPRSHPLLASPFPKGTRLRSLRFSKGTVTVNLSREIMKISGSQQEKAAVYSIVASLLSLPGVQGVRLLVEGEEVKTLAGHVDTSHTFHHLTGLYLAEDGTLWEKDRPRAAIVIDDLGAGKPEETRELINLDLPLTLAVLPFAPNSKEICRQALNHGHQVILHLPLEPRRGSTSWLGQDPILVGLSGAEIDRRFRLALQRVPGAVGFNNHMGSRATAERRVVEQLLKRASREKLFVLDSRTTMKTQIPQVAREVGIPYAERTVFLDGPGNTGQVERQLRLLAQEAKRRGVAVGIGHVGAESRNTVEILKKAPSIMAEEGVQLDYLSEIVR